MVRINEHQDASRVHAGKIQRMGKCGLDRIGDGLPPRERRLYHRDDEPFWVWSKRSQVHAANRG